MEGVDGDWTDSEADFGDEGTSACPHWKQKFASSGFSCEQEGQLIDSLCVHYLHEDDRTFFPWNDEELKTTGTRLDGILKDIAEREYPPKVGRRCRSCEFKNMCTAFLVSPMVTRNSAGGNNQLEDAI